MCAGGGGGGGSACLNTCSLNSRKTALKNIISDLAGFFSSCSMVKGQGQNSNRNTVKQTAENGQKSPLTMTLLLRHWCQATKLKAPEWFKIQPGVIGFYGRSLTK